MLKLAAPWILCIAAAAAQTPLAPPDGYDAELWARALALHRQCTVVDTHIDTTSRILDEDFEMGSRASSGHVDLPRLQQGGLDAVFYSIYVDSRFFGDEAPLFAKPAAPGTDWPRPVAAGTPNGSTRRALAMIDGLLRTVERHPDRMRFCSSVAELRAAVRDGRHAALMGIEGGHAIEGDLRLLRMFHQLGVRYMTLTHTNHNEFADSCAEATPRWGGLNRLGGKVVAEMNRLGMMVDVSHVADSTFFDVLAVTQAPVICSHSSMRALCGHPRNISDDMLRALARNGGVVMINYNCGFLDAEYQKLAAASSQTRRIQERELRRRFAADSEGLAEGLRRLEERFPAPERPRLEVLVRHVLHALAVGGEDHVGLGSDFDGVPCVPDGMDDVTFLPRLTYELLRHGAAEATVRKILGENLLRVFAAVEHRAQQLAGQAPQQNDAATDHLPLSR